MRYAVHALDGNNNAAINMETLDLNLIFSLINSPFILPRLLKVFWTPTQDQTVYLRVPFL